MSRKPYRFHCSAPNRGCEEVRCPKGLKHIKRPICKDCEHLQRIDRRPPKNPKERLL